MCPTVCVYAGSTFPWGGAGGRRASLGDRSAAPSLGLGWARQGGVRVGEYSAFGICTHIWGGQTRGYSSVQGLGLAVRNCAPSSHLAMRNRVLLLDLVVRNCAPGFLY